MEESNLDFGNPNRLSNDLLEKPHFMVSSESCFFWHHLSLKTRHDDSSISSERGDLNWGRRQRRPTSLKFLLNVTNYATWQSSSFSICLCPKE
ncbi:hypothetical protein NPIL_316391 [Nephila pilipes]|uniref:Uncharacterized protein n=1 Tax=Nephila pilipes TaxID=299642 RepID=A0A8X6ULN0_NEPPI|nr:hypothetical protein NPIL_316391 [Nephila pilipes]